MSYTNSYTPYLFVTGGNTEDHIVSIYDFDDYGIEKEALKVCRSCLNADLESDAIFCWRCGSEVNWRIIMLDFSDVNNQRNKPLRTEKLKR